MKIHIKQNVGTCLPLPFHLLRSDSFHLNSNIKCIFLKYLYMIPVPTLFKFLKKRKIYISWNLFHLPPVFSFVNGWLL